MNCKKCGNVLAPTDTSCKICGEPVANLNNPMPNVQNQMPTQGNQTVISNVGDNAIPSGQEVIQAQSNDIPSFVQSSDTVPNDANSQVNNGLVISNTQPVTEQNVSNVSINNTITNNPMPIEIPVVPQPVEQLNPNQQPLNQNIMLGESTGMVSKPVPSVMSPSVASSSTQTSQPMNNQINFNPSMGNEQPVAMPTQEPKKNSKSFTIIVVVLILVILIMAGILLSKKLFQSNGNHSSTNDTSNVQDVNQINNGSATSTNSFEYKDYQLPIPNNYEATTDDKGYLNLIDKLDRIAISTEVYRGYTIDDIKEELEDIKQNLIAGGATIVSTESKEYNGIEWLIITLTVQMEGQPMTVIDGMSSLGNYSITENYIYNYGTLDTESILTDLSSMYSNATYRGTKQFSATDEKDKLKTNLNTSFDTTIFD